MLDLVLCSTGKWFHDRQLAVLHVWQAVCCCSVLRVSQLSETEPIASNPEDLIVEQSKLVGGGSVLSHWLTPQAKNILIAVGGKPTKLPIEGADYAIVSDHVLDLPERPNKMAIVGGGYIAVEFAGIFNNYGTEVHLVYRQVADIL